jgi:hypothetical protein
MSQTPEQDPFGGADKAPQREHYNTQYIVSHMKKDEMKTRLIFVLVAVALVGAIAMFVIFKPPAEPPRPVSTEATAAPEAKPATAAPAAAKPADAKPAEGSPKH